MIRLAIFFAGVILQAQPLSLQITPRKAKFVAGEGIVLDLHQKSASELDMETVELNRDRTTITIGSRMLSGKDYIEVHHAAALDRISRAFHAKAGSAWTSPLNLFDYTRPLPAGRYRISVAYRYNASQTVTAGPIEIEVLPAKLVDVRFRWFGGSGPREELASLWRTETQWFYQTAEAFDPSVVKASVNLGAPPASMPVLAHLNDIGANQYDRVAVWTDGARICSQKIHEEGAPESPACAETGLSGPLRIADPPLQLRSGGFAAVVTGNSSSAVLVQNGRSRPISLTAAPTSAVVVWSETEEPLQGQLYWAAADGSITRSELASGQSTRLLDRAHASISLVADQWLGHASVFGLIHNPAALEVHRWNHGHVQLPPHPVACAAFEAVPLASGEDIATGCQVNAHLVAGPSGVFHIAHDATRGFSATR